MIPALDFHLKTADKILISTDGIALEIMSKGFWQMTYWRLGLWIVVLGHQVGLLFYDTDFSSVSIATLTATSLLGWGIWAFRTWAANAYLPERIIPWIIWGIFIGAAIVWFQTPWITLQDGPPRAATISTAKNLHRAARCLTTWALCPWIFATFLAPSRTARGAIAISVLIIVTASLSLVPVIMPNPHIDVLMYLRKGSEALAHGANPYDITYPQIYGPGDVKLFYPPGFLEGSAVFPYLPLNLWIFAPFQWVLGDGRWAYVLMHVITILMLGRLARTPGKGDLQGYLLMAIGFLTPRIEFGISQAWVDPILVATATWFAWTMRERNPLDASASGSPASLRGLALGAIVSAKQILWPFVPILGLWALGLKRRAWMAAAIIPLLTTGWFLAHDVAGFVYDTVTFHSLTPIRYDTHTLIATWCRLMPTPRCLGDVAPYLAYIGVAIVYVAGLPAWYRERHQPQPKGLRPSFLLHLLATGTLTCLLLAKQAFYNYYYTAFFLALIALAADREPHKE